MKSFVLSALALASAASAHFTLDYPTTRGFDEDLEPSACPSLRIIRDIRTDGLEQSSAEASTRLDPAPSSPWVRTSAPSRAVRLGTS